MRTFKPRLGPTLATIVVFPLLISLGFWQLDRAEEKRQSAAAFARGQLSPPTEINQGSQSGNETFFWKRVVGTGTYQSISILLDNRIRDGRAGYDVLTPLITTDGTAVLVDRGWLPASADRAQIPTIDVISEAARYQGNLGPPPATGIAINEYAAEIESLSENIYRVQRIDLDLISRKISTPLINGVLFLSDESPYGYLRDWPTPGFNPEKHEAYATQWFVMAVIVAGLFIILNLKQTDTLTSGREET